MAKNNRGEQAEPTDPNARLITSDADKVKASKWFERARELGGKRQFDYAVEYYVSGLEFYPDAVEEACKPLHGCAVARRQTGGKKPGLKDTLKRSTNDKDPKRAFVNSLWLFGRDPDNLGYLEAITRNAGRTRAEDAAKWAAGVFLKALETAPKASVKQIQSLIRLVEEFGDRAAERGESTFGVETYQIGIDALNIWRRKAPRDHHAESALKNLSTKLIILKGKYDKGDSYRDSIVDNEGQTDLHDLQRSVQSEDRMASLIAKAKAAFEADPDAAGLLKDYVDLLCRREKTEDEAQAIAVLFSEHKRTNEYRWKQLADDIRARQLGRECREVIKGGDEALIKQARIAHLRHELTMYIERVEKYPTDLRLRFELAVRRFNAGQFDEAIPLFQSARSDPKNQAACGMYLGRCFYRKKYHSQAVSALEDAISGHDAQDDELGKTMRYWLARALEGSGSAAKARDTYGDILQMDYNYRDVRARMDALEPEDPAGPAG